MNEEMCAGLLYMDYREFQDIVIRYCGKDRQVLYWLTHTNLRKGVRQCAEHASLPEALYVRSVFALIGYQDPLGGACRGTAASRDREKQS